MTDAINSLPSIGLSTLPMAHLVRRGAIEDVRASSPGSLAEEILVAMALASREYSASGTSKGPRRLPLATWRLPRRSFPAFWTWH